MATTVEQKYSYNDPPCDKEAVAEAVTFFKLNSLLTADCVPGSLTTVVRAIAMELSASCDKSLRVWVTQPQILQKTLGGTETLLQTEHVLPKKDIK